MNWHKNVSQSFSKVLVLQFCKSRVRKELEGVKELEYNILQGISVIDSQKCFPWEARAEN